MPEWPDLHVLRARLESALVGRTVVGARTGDPVVLRSSALPSELLTGRRFAAVRHRGKFLAFDLDDGVAMVVNPMLSGLFLLSPVGAKATRDTRLRIEIEGGRELRYRDDTRMGKVYIFRGDPPEIPGYAELGPDAGTLDWSREEFARRARATRKEVRNLLMDQRFIAGIGNAYADEILWQARLHPKVPVRTLSDAQLGDLRDAIASVLRDAVVAVEAGLPPELGVKVRTHMRIRGREGQPCPRCGGRIVRSRSGDDEADRCPVCQPPPKGQLR